jgi:UDP-N-acetylglucosamine diphosphorylase/glucosamine-1-phosphate N-acetyltransferase
MNVVLFDNPKIWKNLLPLTYTRPVSEIRIGILTIRGKWEKWLGTSCSYFTEEYLSQKFPLKEKAGSLLIASNICPDKDLVSAVKALKEGEALMKNGEVIAFAGRSELMEDQKWTSKKEYAAEVFEINHVWDIFRKNGEAIAADFELITKGRKSQALSKTVTVIGDASLVFAEEGAYAEACVINTKSGPVYLGKDSEIMEGSAVRGPFALCEHSTLKLNAKIYGPTTIGPHCKVGGEVSNCVIFGFSNKAHDGFIGNSVLGEWCNLGADTNSSNLKNNYANVKLFSYAENKNIDTGLQFCGLIMGDHSKSGINTMFNTGTVVGVGANIFGGGFPPTHLPSFTWGGAEKLETYKTDKMFETAQKVFERRSMVFDQKEKDLLMHVYKITSQCRNPDQI